MHYGSTAAEGGEIWGRNNLLWEAAPYNMGILGLGRVLDKVLEYKYKYLKKWQVQVLDFQKYLSTSTFKSTWVQYPLQVLGTLVVNCN